MNDRIAETLKRWKENLILPSLEPAGLVIIGNDDPRTLDVGQFEHARDLLYHGGRGPSYRSNFDYTDRQFLATSLGSWTLGAGYYTTDSRPAAENYARVRDVQQDGTQAVVKLLPFHAKMFDFRLRKNSLENAPVPLWLKDKWLDYYAAYLRSPGRETLHPVLTESEDEYLQYLRRLDKIGTYDLRQMLQTGTPLHKIGGRRLVAPHWMFEFSAFMGQTGYDGLIYREGPEGSAEGLTTSFVFFNLEVVGDFDYWHQRK